MGVGGGRSAGGLVGVLVGVVLGSALSSCSDSKGFALTHTIETGSGGVAALRRPSPGRARITGGGAAVWFADAGTSGAGGTGLGGATSAPDAGAAGTTAGAAGAEPTPISAVRLELCRRLPAPQQKSQEVVLAYRRHVYQDCRAQRMILENGSEVYVFLNTLNAWTFAIWGCTSAAASGFGPLRDGFTVTVADLVLLSQLYVTATDQVIELSVQERVELRDALERLAAAVPVAAGVHHQLAVCEDGVAGAGGTTGAEEVGFAGAAGATLPSRGGGGAQP